MGTVTTFLTSWIMVIFQSKYSINSIAINIYPYIIIIWIVILPLKSNHVYPDNLHSFKLFIYFLGFAT